MNKTKIKNFSIWARRHLIEVVAYRMRFLGIDENGIAAEMAGSTPTLKLYDMGTSKPAEVADRDIAKRVRLAAHIKDHEANSNYKTAYETVVEEIAYTWFNRLIAIRFMEVNDYLPSGVRVLSSESGKREPDIVTQAVEVAEDQGFAITQDEIWKLKDENKLDELFRIMFIQQCKKLHDVLPELFDNSMDDYTELLLPISFIDDDGFIRHLVSDIDEADFDLNQQGQVEIIGWLYQYYNSEKKDAVFAAMSNKVKVSKENIAAATQLFTPDWIVRYMVENSLGRLWTDGHPETSAKPNWKYYLEEAEQTEEVNAQLAEIRAGRKDMTPEQITFIDPCMGSGHILVYAFDVLMQIYLSCGYTERDAAQKIVRHNLWGLDLDKRAYQLAYFAVMMKARQYDRRFLGRGITPNLSHFQDLPAVNNTMLEEPLQSFVQQFENADTYGSLITVEANEDIDAAIDAFEGTIGFDRNQLEHFMVLYKILSQRYDVVCTNPPYMASDKMNANLKGYIEKHYLDFKSDFFSAFIVRCTQLAKRGGYLGFLTPYVWMFILTYEPLRKYLYNQKSVETLIQFEYSAFEEAIVPICTFTMLNANVDKVSVYLRLTEFRGGMEVQRMKTLEAIDNHDCGFYYEAVSDRFSKIPAMPIAYWASNNLFSDFENNKPLGDILPVRKGLTTADNNRFLRFWYEVKTVQIDKKWFRTHKGGEFRKWYGNDENVVNWENNGAELKAFKNAVIRNEDYYFRKCFSWNDISSSKTGFRYVKGNSISNASGPSVYCENDDIYYYLGLCNSKVVEYILTITCPTIHFEVGRIAELPVITDDSVKAKVESIAQSCVELSKNDWDSFETSWDFKRHPLITHSLFTPQEIAEDRSKHISDMGYIRDTYELWEQECESRFQKLKSNEEELNRIFIDIYGLQDELTPEVEDKDVTVRRADLQREIKSLISYAVGCMLGRYSLNVEGLAYAGGEWDDSKYVTFIPDKDNCLPITEDPFFEDDIVSRFAEFIKVVYGEDTLEENLRFVAENLGIKGNGTAREKIRQYFLKDFFKDHCKTYQKRPIYWQFDTGKKNGFKALCYMHRWDVNTVGNVRIDYMHKLQRLYRNEIIRLQERIDAGEEVAKCQKRLEKITNQLHETEEYDARIGMVVAARTEIDLDDGVKVNYDKVQLGSDGKKYEILAKI